MSSTPAPRRTRRVSKSVSVSIDVTADVFYTPSHEEAAAALHILERWAHGNGIHALSLTHCSNQDGIAVFDARALTTRPSIESTSAALSSIAA